MKQKILHILILLLLSGALYAQKDVGQVGNVDLEHATSNIKKQFKNFKFKDACKISGGITANSVFYQSNQSMAGRAPFTYFLQGNINMRFLSWSMPISYQYTNQGAHLGYQIPFKFNRISISPKYKWIQAHLGDVSMSFSPYTLNGLQFTGGGLELTPKIPLKVSLMGGRIQKAVQYDSINSRSIPAYTRMGYGAKLEWVKNNYRLGIIGYYSKDDSSSIHTFPTDSSQAITPKENLVLSISGKINLSKTLEMYAEYASSALTQDTRAQTITPNNKQITAPFFNERGSTEHHAAYKGGITMNLQNLNVGLQYERVDPRYSTLGAYYFNNDLENITLNINQKMLNQKIDVALNLGYQHDNLEHEKSSQTGRMVGSINISAQINDRLKITTSASNFTTFTNNHLNQFTDINNPNNIDDPNNLDFKQISKNATFNVTYNLENKNTRTQILLFNYSVNDVANEEGGIVRGGDGATVQNAALQHQLSWNKINLALNTSLNYTYNTIGFNHSQIYGFNLGASKSFFKNKINVSSGVGYNEDHNVDGSSKNTNMQLMGAYHFLKKHSFSLSAIQMLRNINTTNQTSNNERTITLGYAYHF